MLPVTLFPPPLIFYQVFMYIYYYSNMKGSVSEFDAVFFHIRNMEFIGERHDWAVKGSEKLPDPAERKPSQRYVMFLDESPQLSWFSFEKFGNFFNWYNFFNCSSLYYGMDICQQLKSLREWINVKLLYSKKRRPRLNHSCTHAWFYSNLITFICVPNLLLVFYNHLLNSRHKTTYFTGIFNNLKFILVKTI